MSTFPNFDHSNITAEVHDVRITNDQVIHVEILRGPQRSGRRAIYIHGGGGGGNHTMLNRPARWMIAQGLFDEILLPDRLGDGASSPLTHHTPIIEHSRAMHALLEKLVVPAPLTAMGISYGGPIALTLAHLDARIHSVILFASSPTLTQTSPVVSLMLESGLLGWFLRFMMRRNVGKLPSAYVDLDPVYDLSSPKEMASLFYESLKRQPAERLRSLIFEVEDTLDKDNASIPEDVCLDIPILQIIGERDEVWGTKISGEYRRRFPRWEQRVVPGARIHKHAILKGYDFCKPLLQGIPG